MRAEQCRTLAAVQGWLTGARRRRDVGCPRKCRDRGYERWVGRSPASAAAEIRQRGRRASQARRWAVQARGRAVQALRHSGAQSSGVEACGRCRRDLGSCGLVVSHPVPPAKRWRSEPKSRGEAAMGAGRVVCQRTCMRQCIRSAQRVQGGGSCQERGRSMVVVSRRSAVDG